MQAITAVDGVLHLHFKRQMALLVLILQGVQS